MRGMTEATSTIASTESGRGGKKEDPPGRKQNDGAGWKYRVGGMETEESAADSAKWSGEETEESELEGEAETSGGGWGRPERRRR